ncbi:hypothetical protein PFISCL1PPCAC_4178, partial [Pristionchus fissidentatus]
SSLHSSIFLTHTMILRGVSIALLSVLIAGQSLYGHVDKSRCGKDTLCRVCGCRGKVNQYQFEKIDFERIYFYKIWDYCVAILQAKRLSTDSLIVTIQLLPSQENPASATVTMLGKSENCKLKLSDQLSIYS